MKNEKWRWKEKKTIRYDAQKKHKATNYNSTTANCQMLQARLRVQTSHQNIAGWMGQNNHKISTNFERKKLDCTYQYIFITLLQYCVLLSQYNFSGVHLWVIKARTLLCYTRAMFVNIILFRRLFSTEKFEEKKMCFFQLFFFFFCAKTIILPRDVVPSG